MGEFSLISVYHLYTGDSADHLNGGLYCPRIVDGFPY
ncbi:TPA_asm: hypothetical protein [ssRNA phage Esthiorhiza.2_20]|uniref:Uncharacterized protein n=1 Tax=ssRNA phage Esthiorhiza.2_20 TaxID=2786037 RepID=A0A8S5L3U4_9VIRU|nr:hypothetical protein QIP29_gp3 [ssRNA phage Esthiorhiza.2_20]DAD51997.1 TPA_asm: hypothetical protein [ssRNA phage Esthiorhiza.2_20]